MKKRVISIPMLIIFVLLEVSCAFHRYENSVKGIEAVRSMKSPKQRQLKILAALNTSGKWIGFSEEVPARIVNDHIVGRTPGQEGEYITVKIPLAEVERVLIREFKSNKRAYNMLFLGLVGGVAFYFYMMYRFTLD